ncbi:MAG: site-specific DNA-methyltransferase [Candidatus Lokiarchaeota archaeon]|nr:site-specific DNA-methyltransferase [Candidatus Lokiarchaeota archaeon]
MISINWEGKDKFISNIEKRKQYFSNIFKNITSCLDNSITNERYTKCSIKNWNRKLFWGNNIEIIYYLLNFLKDKIDLVYIDPPFFTRSNYKIQINEDKNLYEDIAYYDTWNKDINSYLQMLYKRLFLIKSLLSEKGLIFVHLDWHANHYVKIILDEIFGTENFINSIVWYYYNKYSAGKMQLPRAHDDILVYSKTKHYSLNEIRVLRKKPIKQLKRINVNGTLKNLKDRYGKVIYRTVKDKKIDDVWKIPCLQPASKHWLGYPTQKHPKLLERIIKLGSNENDLIADFFCGSGTTLITAERLGRKWIGSDISKYAIYLTRKMLLNHYEEFENLNNKNLELWAHLDEEKKKIINSNFFKKELKIQRIK